MEQHERTPLGPAICDQEYEIIKTLDLYRGLILDALELRLKERTDWKQIRSNMLKLLGNNGLEDRLRRIVRDESGRHGNR
jgi:hypothetical protein